MAPKSLVKIGLVSAKIYLVWTNVARTNVAWTMNITVTAGQLFKMVQGSYHSNLVKIG